MEDVPVPGGTAATARSLGIVPAPDPARFVAEVARLTHPAADSRNTTRGKAASLLRRAGEPAGSGTADTVPIPLSVNLWSTAVFRRQVAPADIVAAIVADPRAAHLCYGLAGLDDDTLQFLVEHPALITKLYERHASLLAAFGEGLHIRGGRVVAPGGPVASPLWEAVVGEKLDRPAAFLDALFSRDQGRVAYLFDTISELDAPRAAFAVGAWIKDPSVRLKRFKLLVASSRTAVPQWQPAKLPFSRPLHDVASLLSRVQVQPDGSPAFPSQRSAWVWIFESVDVPSSPPHTPAADDESIDAAWLAQIIAQADTRERGERLDQLAFGQRVFQQPAGSAGELLTAIRGFARFRMLNLTLERMGVREPSVYAAAARRAQQLSTLDRSRAIVALGQFQGALALVARMTSVHTLELPAAQALVTSLSNVATSSDGRYAGAIAEWIRRELRPLLPAAPDAESAVLAALSGRRGLPQDAAAVEWEGNSYRLDIPTAEERRLLRIRAKQGEPTIDAALEKGNDEVLADALMAWTYAVSIAGPDSPVLLTDHVAKRHDFGLGLADRHMRQRIAWALPRPEIAVGSPWHVMGALLGLDVALSGQALRRVGAEGAIDAPTLSTNERDAFAATVALMNPFELRDRDRDAIAAAIERGRGRAATLAEDSAGLPDVVAEVQMDGWRSRALQWTVAHDPGRISSLFSMTELLVLGRARLTELGAWGMSALASLGCLCTRVAPTNAWRLLTGRPQVGLMAETVADLNLLVAVMLRELSLPAAAAKAVLSAAVRDFIDEARPTDFNDWLTLVRTAQSIPRERVEDYVTVATSDGPLVRQ